MSAHREVEQVIDGLTGLDVTGALAGAAALRGAGVELGDTGRGEDGFRVAGNRLASEVVALHQTGEVALELHVNAEAGDAEMVCCFCEGHRVLHCFLLVGYHEDASSCPCPVAAGRGFLCGLPELAF